MVCNWGMSDRLGPVTFGKTEEHPFLGREIQQHSKEYSEATAEIIDEEVRKFIEGAERTATNIIRENLDSLHKLPFKNLSERRTGIDEWLRNLEAIRDEENVSFLVISELSRGAEGTYNKQPDLASFKESGDIEYSADNAIILQPNWNLLDPLSTDVRKSTLWLVASRESSPGKVAEYALDFPYWGFKEME